MLEDCERNSIPYLMLCRREDDMVTGGELRLQLSKGVEPELPVKL